MSEKVFQNKKTVRTKKKKESEEGNEVEDVIIEEESVNISKNLENEDSRSKEPVITKTNEAQVTKENIPATVEEKKEIKVETVETKPLRNDEKPKKEVDVKYNDNHQNCTFHKCYPWILAIGVFVGSWLIYRKMN